MRKGTTIATVFALMGLFTLAGCGEKTNEEKMQDAAGDMQDAGDDMKDAAEDAADDAKKALEGK